MNASSSKHSQLRTIHSSRRGAEKRWLRGRDFLNRPASRSHVSKMTLRDGEFTQNASDKKRMASLPSWNAARAKSIAPPSEADLNPTLQMDSQPLSTTSCAAASELGQSRTTRRSLEILEPRRS